LRVVLDLRSARYSVLDETASELWRVLAGEAAAEDAFAALRARYDIGDERLRAELAAFARHCLEQGLLEPRDARAPGEAASLRAAPRARAAVPVPRAVRAWWSLAATRRALLRDGFGATYERYGALPCASRATPLAAALAAFVRAENAFVAARAPNDCLLRSLALFRFLRGQGIAAAHAIGVRRVPFAAHAWVTCGGAPVLDELAPLYTPLAVLGAR
jgi:Transglutaminase-like superfamily/Coenzyme PQQ synthesis protein D (PqqD)